MTNGEAPSAGGPLHWSMFFVSRTICVLCQVHKCCPAVSCGFRVGRRWHNMYSVCMDHVSWFWHVTSVHPPLGTVCTSDVLPAGEAPFQEPEEAWQVSKGHPTQCRGWVVLWSGSEQWGPSSCGRWWEQVCSYFQQKGYIGEVHWERSA